MGIKASAVAAVGMSALSGCASIVNGGMREVSVGSEPPGAKVSIYNRSNSLVSTHTTPFTAQLEPKYGYFKGENYRLVFEKDGFTSSEAHLKSTLSGWYFGNILFGGLIGMLAVDPATGAMFNIAPKNLEHELTPAQTPADAASATAASGSAVN
ncbi:MAG: hypothetical protein ACREV5_15230 [Steroidobacter sp.]